MITKQTLFTNWNFLRWIRLIMGVSLGIQAIQTQNVVPGIVAALFLFQVITNVGCYMSNSCNNLADKSKQRNIDDTTFEEIKRQ